MAKEFSGTLSELGIEDTTVTLSYTEFQWEYYMRRKARYYFRDGKNKFNMEIYDIPELLNLKRGNIYNINFELNG